jgi:hypothetical protein
LNKLPFGDTTAMVTATLCDTCLTHRTTRLTAIPTSPKEDPDDHLLQQLAATGAPRGAGALCGYSFNTATLEALAPLVADSRLSVPLIDAFSSGKSRTQVPRK